MSGRTVPFEVESLCESRNCRASLGWLFLNAPYRKGWTELASKKHFGWSWGLVCITGLLLLLSACASGDMAIPATARSIDAVNAPEFRPVTDIPIPEDARLDTERSLILSSRDQWTGRIVLKVSQPAGKAFAFYQREMPAFRWTPVMSVQSETSVLAFTRENRAATVQIQERNMGGALVIVTIAPRQTGELPAIQAAPMRQ